MIFIARDTLNTKSIDLRRGSNLTEIELN